MNKIFNNKGKRKFHKLNEIHKIHKIIKINKIKEVNLLGIIKQKINKILYQLMIYKLNNKMQAEIKSMTIIVKNNNKIPMNLMMKHHKYLKRELCQIKLENQ